VTIVELNGSIVFPAATVWPATVPEIAGIIANSSPS
jgi:hypothetical protein